MDRFFITTPMYYVNDNPHLGHAYTNIISDVICRIMKLSHYEGFLLTGTDEHGAKIESAAKASKYNIEQFVENNSNKFRMLAKAFDIEYNDFIRTTEQRHKDVVINVWNDLVNSGNVYLGHYKGWYVKKDEAFYTEKELKDLSLSTTSPEVEWLEEESYFFKLSSWKDKLLEFYDASPDFILPDKYRTEIVNFVKSGLNDLSISRKNLNWGISVPNSDHVIYVWIDALASYLIDKNQSSIWPADLHVIGKDILKFHAIFWPALLMALNLPLPKSLLVHGWWKSDGAKMSKSLGNIVDPVQLLDKFDSDTIRYALLRMITIGNDGNFTENTLISINDSELANKIGNLVNRVSKFLILNFESQIPQILQPEELYNSSKILSTLKENTLKWKRLKKYFNLSAMIEILINIADSANIFFDQSQIWAQKDIYKQKITLFQIIEVIRYLGIMMQPFTPNAAKKILDQFNIPTDQRTFNHLAKDYVSKGKIKDSKILFKKLSKNII